MHKTIELLENYCDRFEKELGILWKKIEKSDVIPTADLDAIDKLFHAMKSDKTICAMLEYAEDEESEDGGYSGKYYSAPTYTRRYSNNGYSGRNDGGYSGRRGGRGYSRDSEKSDMIRKLEDMLNRARSDDEAMAIQDTIDVVTRMN